MSQKNPNAVPTLPNTPAAPRPVAADAPAGLSMVTVPVGYKLVLDESAEAFEERTARERDELAAECALPLAARVQKIADKKYPMAEGLKRFRVTLEDRNGFPQLVIPARSGREARVCFEDVCGILSVDEPDKKYHIEEVNEPAVDANAKHAADAAK